MGIKTGQKIEQLSDGRAREDFEGEYIPARLSAGRPLGHELDGEILQRYRDVARTKGIHIPDGYSEDDSHVQSGHQPDRRRAAED